VQTLVRRTPAQPALRLRLGRRYEELESSKKSPATKATSVSWPNYLTTDTVAPLPVRLSTASRFMGSSQRPWDLGSQVGRISNGLVV
jgi:hypothetical protein